MSAKIIQLNDYRRAAVKIEGSSVSFPQLYRLTGHSWRVDENGRRIPDERFPWTYYSLDQKPTDFIANARFEAISHLDPRIDSGWVIIRHHRNRDSVEGYIDCRGDTETSADSYRMTYQTEQGLFTVLHRQAIRGRPDHLTAYATKVPHPVFEWDHRLLILDGNGLPVDEHLLTPMEEGEDE